MNEETSAFLVRTVAVIGAGRVGRAFALRCAQAGFAVALEDVMPSNLRRAQDEYTNLGLDVANSGTIRYALTVEDAVADADLAIDFVPDELESKLEIFSLLDRMAPPRTILCTPTNVLSVTDLASCTYRAGQCVALRSQDDSLAEVILVRSRFTLPCVPLAITDFLTKLGVRWSVEDDGEEPMLVKNLAQIRR